MRKGFRKDDFIIAVLNFQPGTYHGFKIGVPFAGTYQEVFNSDETRFGGSGQVNGSGTIASQQGQYHGQEQFIEITVPPVGGVLLAPVSIDDESTANSSIEEV